MAAHDCELSVSLWDEYVDCTEDVVQAGRCQTVLPWSWTRFDSRASEQVWRHRCQYGSAGPAGELPPNERCTCVDENGWGVVHCGTLADLFNASGCLQDDAAGEVQLGCGRL